MKADNKQGTFILLIPFMLVLLPVHVMGQQTGIDKEIVVVKPYQPTLSDAYKINVMPEVTDSISLRPSFDYVINPRKYKTGFNIQPIQAASIVGEPIAKLNRSYLRLGFGNYLRPLAELHISSTRNREKSLGAYLKHTSINGKLKLDQDTRIKPGYQDNLLKFYGKRMYRKGRLSGAIEAGYMGLNYYGVNTDSLQRYPDYENNLEQNYIRAGGNIRYESTDAKILDLDYDLQLGYDYLQDRNKQYQHQIDFTADLKKEYALQVFGAGLGARHYAGSPAADSSGFSIFRIDPWLSRSTDEYSYTLGAKLAGELSHEGFNLFIYPKARLQINVVDKILVPYLGLGGRLEDNRYARLVSENPYVVPGLSTGSTSHKLIVYGGVKGSFTTKLTYDLYASYSIVDNMYFYINDTLPGLGNRFITVSDDVGMAKIFGTLTYQHSERLGFHLNQTVYSYDMENEQHPWHRQLYDLTFTTRYNLQDKIMVGFHLFYTGDMYARNYRPSEDPYLIDGTLDLNLELEYRYTRLLSAFVRFNHLLGSENFMYWQYPTMRFQLMAGFTYSL